MSDERPAVPLPRRRGAGVVSAASVLALLAAAPAATAAPAGPTKPPLPVLELAADAEHEVDAQVLTNELRRAVLEAPEYAGTAANQKFLTVAVRAHCATGAFDRRLTHDSDRALDAACLTRVGARLDHKRMLWGYLYEQSGALFAKVHLYREGEADRAATVPYDRASGTRAAQRLYAKLVTPERVGDVRVEGEASLAGAELVAGDVAHGPFKPGVELTVPAGELRLKARREGKVVAEGKTQVEAGKAAEVRLWPAFEPSTRLDPTAGLNDPPPVDSTRGAWKRTAGFVGLGLGAALVGAGILSSLRVEGVKDDFASEGPLVAYRSGVPTDPCDAAGAVASSSQPGAATAARVDRLCSGLSTFEIAQFVFYGAGALAAGAGAYLLATAPRAGSSAATTSRPARAAWALRPWGGPKSGGLGLDVSF